MSALKIIKLALLSIGAVFASRKRSKILYYHDICSIRFYESPDTDVIMGTPIELFKKHIEIIKKRGYKIIQEISNDNLEVAIMFDDGYRGIWDNRDYFYENNICPTVFLAVDLIGKPNFLNIEEILELQNHGFKFECHSWSHKSLARLTPEILKKELGDSKDYLSKILNKDVTEICLPLGYYSDSLLQEIKKYDYKKVYSSIPGSIKVKIAGVMETRNLCQFASPLELKLILDGGGEILKKRYIKQHCHNNIVK